MIHITFRMLNTPGYFSLKASKVQVSITIQAR